MAGDAEEAVAVAEAAAAASEEGEAARGEHEEVAFEAAEEERPILELVYHLPYPIQVAYLCLSHYPFVCLWCKCSRAHFTPVGQSAHHA